MNPQSTVSKNARQQPLSRRRRLSILRHAKAEEGDGDDVKRALNERGQRDARHMGKFLKKHDKLPELILCSTAQRTRETLAALDVMIATQLSAKLYLASTGELISFLQQADDAVQHILLIGHNPGLHSLVATLTDDYENEEDEKLIAQKFPTCAYVSMVIPAPRWKDIAPMGGALDTLAIGSKL